MKKIIFTLIALMAVCFSANAESNINIKINDTDFETSPQPIMMNDRVLVPMRSIFERLGAEVYWENSTKMVTAIKGADVIMLQIDNNKLFKPNESIDLDVAPIVINDRTMVPLRAVSSSLGAEVDWDNDTKTVYINYKEEKSIQVSIEVEGYGNMEAELYPEIAPETVKNFVKLANEGFYDGLVFHRIIDGFMIQGGGYDKNLNIKKADSIKGEFSQNGFNNTLKHTKGVLSMARTSDPNSASSQFFIMDGDASYLDGAYAAFGKLTSGIEVLEKLSAVETKSLENGMDDVPVDLPVIKTIKVTSNE